MTGSAADPVVTAVARWIDKHRPAGPVTVACSGGADSLALAAAVATLGRAGRAVTVDHGLQPGSAGVAAAAAASLTRLGFDARVVRVDVTGAGGLEAAARRARQAALIAAADGPVLLGHTRDDQAETVLLGLARGSGPRSIAGMAAWNPPWGRPLLTVRRADTEAACAAAGLTWWSDPHNTDPRFVRARLRGEVLPLLEDVLGGGVVAALARTADLLADDLVALDALADDARRSSTVGTGAAGTGTAGTGTGDAGAGPAVAALAAHPAAIRRRVLRAWAAEVGAGALTADHLARLDDLIVARPRGGGAVRLPGALDVVVVGDRLVADRAEPPVRRSPDGGRLTPVTGNQPPPPPRATGDH